MAKLTNAIENDVVKKTDYNIKVTNTEAQIAGLTNSFITRTKFQQILIALDDKIDGVEKKKTRYKWISY